MLLRIEQGKAESVTVCIKLEFEQFFVDEGVEEAAKKKKKEKKVDPDKEHCRKLKWPDKSTTSYNMLYFKSYMKN